MVAFPVPENIIVGAGQISTGLAVTSSTGVVSTTTATLTANYNASIRSAAVTITPSTTPVSISCLITPSPVVLGQGATVTSTVSGGTPPYAITTAGLNSASTLVLPTTQGIFTASASVGDALGQTASTTCTTNVIVPTPTLTSLQPDRTPPASQPFYLTINGTGFATGVAVYLCQSTCYPHGSVSIVWDRQFYLANVQWNATGTVNMLAVNVGNLTSNSLPLIINR